MTEHKAAPTDKSRAFWDRIAQKYAQMPVRDADSYARTLDRVRAHLTPQDRVLELGCGTGSTALALAPQVAQITGTDLSPAMIDIARAKAAEAGANNADFAVADGTVAGDGVYDVVLAFNLLHLLPDPADGIAHARAMLKPGGLFISKTFCFSDRALGLLRIVLPLLIPVLYLLGRAPRVRFLKIAELEEMVQTAGFEIVERGSYPVRPPSRFIVARKT